MLNATRDLTEAIVQTALELFPRVHLTVTGTCMVPALVPGRRVAIVSSARRRPLWGDIVLVRHPEGLRLHRLVWRWPFSRTWLTKGDRAVLCDPRRTAGDVLGTVIALEERGARRRAFVSLVQGLRAWSWTRLGRPLA